MKKKSLLSILLVVAMVISQMLTVVFAKQGIDTGVIDFEDYIGTWDKTQNSTIGELPEDELGTFTKNKENIDFAPSNGITSGSPAGDTSNGKSMKVYYEYDAESEDYAGFKYALKENIYNTVHVGFSIYYDSILGGEYIYFRGESAVRAFYITGTRKINPFNLKNEKGNIIYMKDSSDNDFVLDLDKWYSFDTWYNMDTEEFKVVVSDSSGPVSEYTGISTTDISYMYRLDLRSYAALNNSNNNKNTGIAEIYWDNFRINSDWKYKAKAVSSDSTDTYDFTGVTDVSSISGDYGSFAFTGATKNVTLGTETDADKGTCLSYILSSDSQSSELRYNVKSRMSGDYTYKASFMLKDKNFAEMRFRHYYGSGASSFKYNGSSYMMYFTPTSTYILNNCLKCEDGKTNFSFDTNVWYEYSMSFDGNTGYMTISVSDEAGVIYTYSAYDSAYKGVEYSRTSIANNGALNKNAVDTSSTILIDDITAGYTDSFKPEVIKEYDSFDVAAAASVALDVPFAGTKFKITADITTKDAADTVLIATGDSGDVTLATAGGNASVHSISAVVRDTSVSAICFNAGGDITVDNLKIETVHDFALVEDKSTTGDDCIVDEDSAVKAVFTNKIDRSSFTASSVTMPYAGSGVDFSITFPDDYTAQINFAKDIGTHYHIAFTDVRDIYGNTLTDYIEFDTVLPDLYMTDVQFMRDGSLLALATPGDVSADFVAQANNGKSYDMMFTLGLYSGTKLVKVMSQSFTVGNVKEPHSVELDIPDDGNYYVVKAFLWSKDNIKPYIKEKVLKSTTDLPVVILRFDDLKSQKISDFDEVTRWLDDYDLKACYGFMGKQILTNVSSLIRDEFDAKVTAMKNNPRIELWHHGYEDNNMYEGQSIEVQRADFANCIDGAYEKYGIVFTAFCPPSNKLDETTLKLMNEEFTNFKVLMLSKSLEEMGYEDNYNFTTLSNQVRIEASDAILPLETLKANWQEAVEAGHEYVVMYSHPGYSWNKLTTGSETEYGKDTLTQFVQYLKSEGVVFMNPTEYAEYAEALK